MASTGRTRVRGGGYAPAQALPHGRVVDVRSPDGVRLHTEVFGPQDGYPIVLAHGITCAIRVWAHQIAELAEHYRVIAYDHRGHGRSSVPSRRRGYSLDHLAADLDAVLEATLEPGERAVIAGHSMGGIAITSWSERLPGARHAAGRRRRVDQHHDRRPAAQRQLPAHAAPALGGAGAGGGFPAEDLRRGTAAAGRRPAEPPFRVDARGGQRRRPRHRRFRVRVVQRHPAGRARGLGAGPGRPPRPAAHHAEEPDRADTGHRQPERPSAADGLVAPHRGHRARTWPGSSSSPAGTARSWSGPPTSTNTCGG